MKTVEDILQTKGKTVYSIDGSASVYDGLLIMDQHHIGSLMVTNNDKLIGIVTERDYACKVIIQGRQSKTTLVKEIMTPEPVVTSYATTISECMPLMTFKRVRHLPVIENQKIVGLVSIGDVVKEIIEEQDIVIKQLESYIHA